MAIRKGNTSVPIFIPEQNFRYGIRNRPPTPVKRVLSNDYQRESIFLKRQYLVQHPVPHFISLCNYFNQTSVPRRKRFLPIINKSTFLYAEASKARRAQLFKDYNRNAKRFKMHKWNKIVNKVSTKRKAYIAKPKP